jgi:carboxyl-terminal processing protease
MIQRPWDGTFDEYLTYSMRAQSPRAHTPAERKYTTGGRVVYSGGGIEPDHHVSGPIEGFDPSRFGRLLAARQEFASFAERFSAAGDQRIAVAGRDRKLVARGFAIDAALVEEFKAHVRDRGLTVDDEQFAADIDFITAMMRYQIDEAVFGVEEARRNLFDVDPQIRRASALFDDAERLLEGAGQAAVVAAR